METPETLAERLGHVSHFLKLPLADRLAIILAGQMRLFTSDETIFSEGEPCAGMFVLLKGHVHICKHGTQGQQTIIAEVDPVIMFNEVALIDGGPNPFTAIASHNSLAWQISLGSYQKLVRRYARDIYMSVSLGLLKIMAGRYRQLLDAYSDLSFLSVPDRVAKMIFELSDEGRIPINRQENSINEMAAHISSVPEMISRSLNVLKCQGIIATTRTSITVLKPQELAKMAKTDAKQLFIYGHKN